MTFLATLALAVALLVVAPYVAHRLRRRRADEQPFPPARLVSASPPKARRRSRLEDRALLSIRAAALAALAILGATPLVRCSRLSLERTGGASIAMVLVVDDSMSMRADAGGRSRFERARAGARELLASARDGDAVGIVLAGAPARVALAATTDLASARRTIDDLAVTDRATDLDGAVILAADLVASLPQVDRRVVALSDLADGNSDGPALGESLDVPIWVPLPDLRLDETDCAVLRADKRGATVRASIACGSGKTAAGREVVVEDGRGNVLGREPLGPSATVEAKVALPGPDAKPERVRLSGADAVASDDVAPIAPEEARGRIAVVQGNEERVATGGAPVLERALRALELDVDPVPIPALPDRVDDYAGDLGVIVDDPPGFTPEQRRAFGEFLNRGGSSLVAIGPHAAAAPLGATLEPVLDHAPSWAETTASGADPSTAGVAWALPASLTLLGATHRAVLVADDVHAFEPYVRWDDGALLVGSRTIGRGDAWVATLPFSPDASDLPLRPGFLGMLDAWTRRVIERAAPVRSEVGTSWAFAGDRDVRVTGPAGPVPLDTTTAVPRVVPSLIGSYRVERNGKIETRIVAPSLRELDLRPRRTVARVPQGASDGRRGAIDESGPVAVALLALMALEMAVRLVSTRRAQIA